ncbi:MAG: hypothetical protein O9322_14920 [Beijerinckiaceae bacterium]|nr:hypothetical protein [Beijerinckiaceae bacterium]MCZ8300641.1 hypothetical protein [Beijerinckiaceae bacterium]
MSTFLGVVADGIVRPEKYAFVPNWFKKGQDINGPVTIHRAILA